MSNETPTLPTETDPAVAESFELRQARLEIRSLRAEIARTAPDLEDLRLQLIAARAQGERYREQVSALRKSSSWRLTLPLRMLSRR